MSTSLALPTKRLEEAAGCQSEFGDVVGVSMLDLENEAKDACKRDEMQVKNRQECLISIVTSDANA